MDNSVIIFSGIVILALLISVCILLLVKKREDRRSGKTGASEAEPASTAKTETISRTASIPEPKSDEKSTTAQGEDVAVVYSAKNLSNRRSCKYCDCEAEPGQRICEICGKVL